MYKPPVPHFNQSIILFAEVQCTIARYTNTPLIGTLVFGKSKSTVTVRMCRHHSRPTIFKCYFAMLKF